MEFLTGIFDSVWSEIAPYLPTSPFTKFINALEQSSWLGFLNWFIPVGDILSIFAAYLGAVGLFYVYSVLMRWVKVISG